MKNWILKVINRHPTCYEIFKFLVIGTITTMLDFYVMSLIIYAFDASVFDYNLVKVFLEGKNASTLAVVCGTAAGFLTGTVFSFWASNEVVFERNKFSGSKLGFLVFTGFCIIGLTIHTAGMWIGYDLLHGNEWLIKVLLTGVVMVFNFITRKFIIFKRAK